MVTVIKVVIGIVSPSIWHR